MNLHVSRTALSANERSKEFRARIDAAHAYRRLIGINPESYWSEMWMWDLVTMPPRVTRKIVPLKRIVSLVCAAHRLSEPEFLSTARHASAVRARHIGFYLARKMTSHSFIKIGDHFNRDHTVVLYGFRRIERMIADDSILLQEIDQYMRELNR